jgi:hypothetical protein
MYLDILNISLLSKAELETYVFNNLSHSLDEVIYDRENENGAFSVINSPYKEIHSRDYWKQRNADLTGYRTFYETSYNLDSSYNTNINMDFDGPFNFNALLLEQERNTNLPYCIINPIGSPTLEEAYIDKFASYYIDTN